MSAKVETKEDQDYSSESEQSESSTSSESGSDVEEVIVVKKKPGAAAHVSELELARREAAKYKAKAAKYKAKSSAGVNVFLGDSSKRTAERQRALYDLS